MLKAFIFDVDGTLVDSVAIHAKTWQEALEEFGHPVDFEILRDKIGKGGKEIMRDLLPDDVVERDGEAIAERRAEILQKDYLSAIKAFPGARDLFQRLRNDGFIIALASSAHGPELQVYKDKAQIADLIHQEKTSDDAERAKPHGDIFQAALDSLDGIEATEAIVIGDTPYDAEAAGKVGLKTVGLLSGGFDESRLRAAGCIAVFRDPKDLLLRYDEWIEAVRRGTGATSAA